MNKLTDSEIVKSLESLLDIMRAYESQQASIGKGLVEDIISMYNRQKAEIENMQKGIQSVMSANVCLINQVGKAKDEAIKEFIEKFKAYIPSIDGDTTMDCVERAIKQAKKEMVGE